MKVLLDANIFISWLLNPLSEGTIATTVNICLAAGEIDLVVPIRTLDEVGRKINESKYLREKVSQNQWNLLKSALEENGNIVEIKGEIRNVTRDPKDDYLIAAAQEHDCEYIVTGDLDLLTQGSSGSVLIITAVQFLLLVQSESVAGDATPPPETPTPPPVSP